MDRIEIICPHCHQLNVRYRGAFAGFLNPRNSRYCEVCGAEFATGRFGGADWMQVGMTFVTVYFFHIFVWSAFIVIPTMLVARLSGAPTPSVQTAGWIAFTVAVVTGFAFAERARRKGQMLSASEAPSAPVANDATAPASTNDGAHAAALELAGAYGAQACVVSPVRKRKLIPWSMILLFGPMYIVAAYSEYGDAPGTGFHLLIPLFIGLAMILGSIAYLLDWPRGWTMKRVTTKDDAP